MRLNNDIGVKPHMNKSSLQETSSSRMAAELQEKTHLRRKALLLIIKLTVQAWKQTHL